MFQKNEHFFSNKFKTLLARPDHHLGIIKKADNMYLSLKLGKILNLSQRYALELILTLRVENLEIKHFSTFAHQRNLPSYIAVCATSSLPQCYGESRYPLQATKKINERWQVYYNCILLKLSSEFFFSLLSRYNYYIIDGSSLFDIRGRDRFCYCENSQKIYYDIMVRL